MKTKKSELEEKFTFCDEKTDKGSTGTIQRKKVCLE